MTRNGSHAARKVQRLATRVPLALVSLLPVAEDGLPDERADDALSLTAVLSHSEALRRPHDIEVAGGLAYVAGKAGTVAIVDIADPSKPRLLGWREDAAELADAQTVLPAGDHLFVGARDLLVFDVHEPARIDLVAKLADRPRVDRINGLVLWGDTLLGACKTGWIAAFDVADAAAPELRGALNARRHGGLASPHDIARAGSCIAVVSQAERSAARLRLYRVASSPEGPVRPPERWEVLGAITRPGWTGANRVVVSGQRVFVASSKTGHEFTLGAADVSEPGAPRHLWTVPFAGVHPTGLEVAGQALFAAGGRTIQVLDVSEPGAPATRAVFTSKELFPTGRDNAHDLVYRDGRLHVTAQKDDRIGVVDLREPRIRALADRGRRTGDAR